MQFKTIDFSKYSSFKIGDSFDVALLDKNTTVAEIQNYYIIGSCNNILMGESPPPLMMLSKEFDYIKIQNNTLVIGAATPSGKIASFCKKNDIANFEFLSHLPGKLGGLVKMNAGLKEYEIFNHLLSIQTLSRTYTKAEIEYGYRYTNISQPILEATFELTEGFDENKVIMFKEMRANQPSAPSAGSCFKNPQGDYAGRLIEAVGLKGVMHGNMCFSTKHANFLLNRGNGVYKDALFLINEAKKRVFEKFNITLELEIEILQEEYLKGKFLET
jgi:UDP-N-acetylmuramate dehydrogenase